MKTRSKMTKSMLTVKYGSEKRDAIFVVEGESEDILYSKLRDFLKNADDYEFYDLRTLKWLGDVKEIGPGIVELDPTNNPGGLDWKVVKA